MMYTELKLAQVPIHLERREAKKSSHILNFACGIVSGLIASVITNPIDVIKTHMQTVAKNRTMRSTVLNLLRNEGGPMRFLDGIALRSFRRTLIAATTWTLYEFFQDSIK